MTMKISKNCGHTLKLLERYARSADRLLDVGCGSGELAHALEQRGFEKVSNVDLKDLRTFSTRHFQTYQDLQIPFDEASFEIVCINFVLHHVPNNQKNILLKEAQRVSKRFVFVLEDTPRNLLDKLVAQIHGRYYRSKHNFKADFGFYSQQQWEKEFLALGFKVVVSERQSRFCRNNKEPYARSFFLLEKKTQNSS